VTCVVGIAQGNAVTIGADSAGWDGSTLMVGAAQKVFRNGPLLIGYTTSFRIGNLLRYALRVPTHRDDQPDDSYLVNDLVDAIRQCLKAGGVAKKENEVESAGELLVGYRDSLYVVASDYSVLRPRDQYAATGCGYQFALGSLWQTATTRLGAESRVFQALGAAEHFDGRVRSPLDVLSLGPEES
jgi:ATP-dependent protease HslVU (ClpYQ) peptidase subunit